MSEPDPNLTTAWVVRSMSSPNVELAEQLQLRIDRQAVSAEQALRYLLDQDGNPQPIDAQATSQLVVIMREIAQDADAAGLWAKVQGELSRRNFKIKQLLQHLANVIVIMDDMKALLDRVAPTTERDRVREIHLRYEAAKEADL